MKRFLSVLTIWGALAKLPAPAAEPLRVTGEIVDAATGTAIPARMYIRGADGAWHFPAPGAPGDVVRYQRANYWDPTQVEMHATLAAKPFTVELPAGEYEVAVERGKEYAPLNRRLTVDAQRAHWRLELKRWIDMAARGWYSGDVHVHRALEDLPNLMLAEDLNVCFPETDWTTSAEVPPSRGDKSVAGERPAGPVAVDATHVWSPRNTEYEIFKVAGRENALGAFLILNHRTLFDMQCPPLRAVAEQAHRDGALIDLEKPNWQWAAVAAPILPADLYELANNHNWRIGFGVKNWGAPAADWMGVSGPLTIDNERDWLAYTWQAYYALLNSGLAINPAAGSASGAHPVPVGYSRVYVHLPEGFSYKAWIAGLKAGHSFATTGPMLLATVDGREPGDALHADAAPISLRVRGEAVFYRSLERIEAVWNGQVVHSITPTSEAVDGAVATRFDFQLPVDSSGWLALRCLAQSENGGGIPFAHTAPWHVEMADRPLRPVRREVEYFLGRVEHEIDRNRGVLSTAQLADYLAARDFWRDKLAACPAESPGATSASPPSVAPRRALASPADGDN